MEVLDTKQLVFFKNKRYSFSGHDTFHCRLLWLKKGYYFLKAHGNFNADDAPVTLGVGKNMVQAIRYWMRAFGLLEEKNGKEFPNTLADLLFGGLNGEEPLDPFLEDNATLWLLHYQLIKTQQASTYWIIFNELRKRKIEFLSDDFIRFVELKGKDEGFATNRNTLSTDFSVFLRMYYRETVDKNGKTKDREDTFSGILTELDLVRCIFRKTPDGRREIPVYVITPTEREDIPAELLLYCLLDSPELGLSISLETLENEPGMPCSVFAMNRDGLLAKIEQLTARYPYITYSDQAGVRELQFKEKPADKYQILNDSYAKALI